MHDLLSLALRSNLFLDDHVVAKTIAGEDILWVYLRERMDYWHRKIEGFSERRIGLYHSNSVDFLAALMAIWKQGRIAVVPANTLDVMVQSVKTTTSVLVGEFNGNSDSSPKAEFAENGDDTALIMFTSGSSGSPKAVSKSFAQLNAELQMLETHWGESVSSSLFVGTVSHHHMYGLPFRLLWPLAYGRPFLETELNYLEQLLPLSRNPLTLVASPAHLENLPQTLDWSQFEDTLSRIYSAGAPLSAKAAKNVYGATGTSVTEIYGSTESGAIAHRNQSQDQRWKPLEGISIKAKEGRLCIKSAAVNDQEWFATDDLCTINNQSEFTLDGRIDRIIKVGGKRVSATAIEHILENHPWVDRARVTLPQNKKSRLAAVVQLLPEGNAQLVDLGKRHICQSLSVSLEQAIDSVARPRYWRFVTKLPTNTQGKTTAVELDALFTDSQGCNLPQIVSSARSDEKNATIDIVIPENLIALEGHFPGMPVLPGVVQIGWVIHFGTQMFGGLGGFLRLEKLKFQGIIKPNEHIRLRLEWDNRLRSLTFSFSNGEDICSNGRIIFTGVSSV